MNLASFGQGDSANNVNFDYPIGLMDLLQEHADFIKEREYSGFRVQVYSGTTKYGAFSARNRLESEFPGLKTYVEFENPYYKVKVGNFRERFSAYSVYKTLLQEFPGAAIYPSEIEIYLPKAAPAEDSEEEEQDNEDNEGGDEQN